MNKSTFAVLVAVVMVTCAVSYMASDNSDALRGNSNLSLDHQSAMIYKEGENHSFTFTVNLADAPAGTTGADICWKFNDLDDGIDVASFGADGFVACTSGISATVYAKKVGSVEVEAYIAGCPDYYASAVVVVKERAGVPATEFHYFFQIKEKALNVATANGAKLVLPAGYTKEQFETGFWIDVKLTETDITASDFNAFSALQWYLNHNGWKNDFGRGGWVKDILGLGTYEENGVWFYWAQYHASNGGWLFNTTTLGYIKTVDESYIGMIFSGTDMSGGSVTFPGYPA